MKRTGFTLIELLVVIAIIAILAAILFPVFAQAREKARETVCLSNKKQIGLGMMQYVQDYDEVYPADNWTYGNTNYMGYQCGWMAEIQPYLKNTQVYECPDAYNKYMNYIPGPGGTVAGRLLVPTDEIGANEWVVSSVGPTTPNGVSTYKGNISEGMIGRPAALPVIADSTFATFNDGTRLMNANYTGHYYQAPLTPDPSFSRHNTGISIVYADGHAKFVHQDAIAWQPNLIKPNGAACGTTPVYADAGRYCWGVPLDPKVDSRLQ